MAKEARARRSPVTTPGYRRGQAPVNKGITLPAEILAPQEVQLLLSSFGSSLTDVRNYAIVVLMYRAGLKVGEIVALERRHFELGNQLLAVPATRRLPERRITINTGTQEARERCSTTVLSPSALTGVWRRKACDALAKRTAHGPVTASKYWSVGI